MLEDDYEADTTQADEMTKKAEMTKTTKTLPNNTTAKTKKTDRASRTSPSCPFTKSTSAAGESHIRIFCASVSHPQSISVGRNSCSFNQPDWNGLAGQCARLCAGAQGRGMERTD